MHVMYIVPRFPVASETFIAEEVIGVRSRGYTVTVVALVKPSVDDLSKLGDRLKSLAEEVVYLPRVPISSGALSTLFGAGVRSLNRRLKSESSSQGRASLRLLRANSIAALAREVGADLLYAHWPRPTEVALLVGEITRLPVAMSIHAHEVAHDNRHFAVAFDRACFAAFCNRAAMDYLLDILPETARSKSHLVYHGVDFSQFTPVEVPLMSSTLHIVTAGRLTPTKGFDRLIRAVGLARDRGVSVTLTILGDGSQRVELEALSVQLGVQNLVSFRGWILQEEMREQLGSSHLFALLADDTFHDGLPNVVLEAMAIGRPVVSSPLPAATEAIEHSVNGYILAEVNGLDEFVECCRDLIADPEKLVIWSRAAAESVRVQHNRATQLALLCDLFAVACASDVLRSQDP